jgi:PEP-CTERM motif
MNHNFGRLAGAVIGCLGLAALAMPARADVLWQFGILNEVDSALSDPRAVYNSVNNGYFNDYNAGINYIPGATDPTTVLTYAPNPASGGLPAATVNLSSESGTADASADLGSGTTHAYLSSGVNDPGMGMIGTGTAVNIGMSDVLTFDIPTGSATITLGYSLDGLLSFGADFGSYTQTLEYSIGSAQMSWQNGASFEGPGTPTDSATGFTGFTFTNQTPGGFQFEGTFTVTDGEVLDMAFFQQITCGGGAVCDFSNTGQMALDLPTGDSFTSNSGVFLTQTDASSAPEPGSLFLMGLGIAAVGCIGRHRLTR